MSPKRSRLKDVDTAGRVRVLQALAWGGAPGFVAGAGIALFKLPDLPPLLLVVGVMAGGLLGASLVVGFAVGVAWAGGWVGSLMLGPPGGSAPARRKEYSFPQSLAVRGRFEEAIRAYENAIAEDPEDPEPYLRIARILRDELERPDEAVHWFRRARREASLSPASDVAISREAIELLQREPGPATRAIPELARLAERFEGTPDGRWARDELLRLKEEVREEEEVE